MDSLLDRFLQAEGDQAILDLAHQLADRNDPGDIQPLQLALNDSVEMRRYGAVYALGHRRRDGRAVGPLIRVLLDRRETPVVRGMAAEYLANLGKRKAIRVLIDGSADESPTVQFWCVFALGRFARMGCRRKAPRAILRALEARLEDAALPDVSGTYWPIRWEALAMLRGTGWKSSADECFRTAILTVLRDPLNHSDLWQWATFYWDESLTCNAGESRGVLDSAVRTVHEAGFDPVRFGLDAADRR